MLRRHHPSHKHLPTPSPPLSPPIFQCYHPTNPQCHAQVDLAKVAARLGIKPKSAANKWAEVKKKITHNASVGDSGAPPSPAADAGDGDDDELAVAATPAKKRKRAPAAATKTPRKPRTPRKPKQEVKSEEAVKEEEEEDNNDDVKGEEDDDIAGDA